MISGDGMIETPRHKDTKILIMNFVPLCLCGLKPGINDALQLNIKRTVIRFDPPADWNVLGIISDPNRKLTLLFVDQPVWSKHFGIHSQNIDAPKDRFHPFLLDNPDRDLVNATAISDENFEASSHFERLSANEVDCRKQILQLSGEISDRVAWLGGWIVWIARSPGHLA